MQQFADKLATAGQVFAMNSDLDVCADLQRGPRRRNRWELDILLGIKFVFLFETKSRLLLD